MGGAPGRVSWLKGSGGVGGVGLLGVLRCAQDDGKDKRKCNGKRRFPAGMTNEKHATAD